VIEMGWNGIRSASEIYVMGEEEVIQLAECPCDVKLQQKVASLGVLISQALYDLEEFSSLYLVGLLLELSDVGIDEF
jgi:hypothetical protein